MLNPKFLTLIASLLLNTWAQKGLPACRRIVCNMMVQNPEFSVDDFDPKFCTHIILRHAPLVGNKLNITYWTDDLGPDGVYEKFRKLKKKGRNLRVLVSVGDISVHSVQFSKMVATEAGRQEFISFLIPFLRERGFDGVDINWYIPTIFGGVPSDKQRYADLVKELADAFDKETLQGKNKKLILSVLGPKYAHSINNGIDISTFARYVDMINLGTVMYHGFKGRPIGHSSPLDSSDGYNMRESAAFWVRAGMPADKLNVGVAIYGIQLLTKSASDMTIGVSEGVEYGPLMYFNNGSFLYYYQICEMIKQGGKAHWDSLAQSPYHIQDNQFTTYENENSLKAKIRFIRENNYGGLYLYAVQKDDHKGTHCGRGKFPMVKAAKSECMRMMHLDD